MKYLAWLGAVAALVGGMSFVWLCGPPSQAGPALVAVAHPLASTSPDDGRVPAPSASRAHATDRCADQPGVPVSITVDGARAQDTPVEAHQLGDVEDGRTHGGSLYVPPDPTHASWLSYADVGPGADHGSAVLAGHVNYARVLGAFGDLTAYQPGQRISVTLRDGRVLTYRVVPAAAMGFATQATALVLSKQQLDADPGLNARIFDFDHSWSQDGEPACGRLVLVTCSGQVIDHDYQDNAFVFALPEQLPRTPASISSADR
jgi:hypothetical protein